MMIAQGASFLVQLGSTTVLARLLSPADFGIITMVMTFSLLFSSFGVNGFVEAIVQREEITESLVSNLFWVNLVAGFLLTAVFAASSHLIANFFHNPLVAPAALGMSLVILLTSVSGIHLALLQRAMRFSAISVNTIVTRFVASLASIVLALMGWGYWALVAGYVVQGICGTAGIWLLCGWIPRLPRRVTGTGTLVKFALNVYSHFSFNYFAGNTDNLLVGWRYGASGLGFYKKAFDLFTLPVSQLISPMGAVVLSTLSRSNNNRDQYERYFLSGMSVLALIGMGIGADFTLVGKDLIRLLLGTQWDETGRIFRYFGPGIGIMLLYNTHGWIHLSIGRPDRWFRWGIIEFLFTAGLFVIALPFGPAAIALAWTVSYFVLMIPSFWYAGHPIGFRVTRILSTVWRIFLASIVAALLSLWLVQLAPLFASMPGAPGAFARLVVDSLLFFALYLVAVVALYGGLGPIRQTLRLIGDLLPQQKAGASLVSEASMAESTQII
jgi:O-antigen/teichoic acid export membrane protein